MCALSHLHLLALVLGLALPSVARAEPRIGTGGPMQLSGPISGASSAEAEVNSFWMDELERRAFSLAVPTIEGSPEGLSAQSSPRYAAYELPEVVAPMLVWAWAFAPPSADVRQALELAGTALTSPDSPLARGLLARDLASELRVRLFEREGRVIFALFVFGTARSKETNLSDVIEGALRAWSVGAVPPSPEHPFVGADAIRSAVNRYLSPQRRAVVELLPRNAPDPALSLRPRIDPANGARTSRSVHSTHPTRLHPVKRGDTLLRIARRYDVSVRELVAENKIDPARPIRLGQKLVVPARRPAERQAGSAAVSARKRTKSRR